MKTKLLLACAWLMLLAIALPVFSTSTPTADDGKWYYVKSQRYGTGGPWWTLNTTTNVASPGALTKADVQKFTLVSTPVSGKVTIKEFSGKLMSAAASGAFDATGAATGWTITPNTVNSIQGYAFAGENSGIHQFNAGNGWKVASGWYSLTDNCTFFFYEAAPNLDLNFAIEDAIASKAAVVVGNSPGQTPQSAVDNFNTAITTAQGTMTSTDSTTLADAISTLNTAKTTFLNSRIPPVTTSTVESPVWYLIKNVGRVMGGTLYTNGFDAQMLCTTTPILADGTGTGAAAPDLKYLFRFEIQSNNSYKIINALYPTGEALQTASGGSNSQVVKYGTLNGSRWNFNTLTGTNPAIQFNVVSTGVGTVWHDASSNALVSWAGGAGSASAWYFEQFTGSLSPLYAPALLNSINTANTLKSKTVAGSTFGQFPDAARATLQTEIDAAQVVYDDVANKTVDQILAAKNTLDAAVITYKEALVTDKNTLLSTNANNFRWYILRNTSSATYAAGKVMSSTGRTEGEAYPANKFTFETVGAPATDSQLFRFEITGTQVSIVNKANRKYVAADGSISSTAALFDLNKLSDGYSFNIKPSGSALHAANSNTEILNYPGDAGSASAWVFEFAEEAFKYNADDFSAAVLKARALYTNTTEGTEYAQFPAAARTAFNEVVAANEAKTPATLTSQEILDGIAALESATATYVAAVNNTDLQASPSKWYTLENAKYPNKYLTLNPETKVLTIADKDNSANQLFRFVKKPANGIYTNLYEIICQSLPTGSIRCESDNWNVVYNTGTAFSTGSTAIGLGYWPWNVTLTVGTNGAQTKLQSIDFDFVDVKSNGTDVDNGGEADAAYNGPAVWKIAYNSQDITTATKNAQSKIVVYSLDQRIIVSGTSEPVMVFNIFGSLVDINYPVAKGLYIIKTSTQTFKVNVQ